MRFYFRIWIFSFFIISITFATNIIAYATEVSVSGGNWIWEERDNVQYGKGEGEIIINYLGYVLKTKLIEWQKNPDIITMNSGGQLKDQVKTMTAQKIIILPEQKTVEFYNVDYTDIDGITVQQAPKVFVKQTSNEDQVYRVYGPVVIQIQDKLAIKVTECIYYPNSLKMLESNHYPIEMSMKYNTELLSNSNSNVVLKGNNAVIYRMPGVGNYLFKLNDAQITQDKSNLCSKSLELSMKDEQIIDFKLHGDSVSQVSGEVFDPSTNELFRFKADSCLLMTVEKSATIEGNVEVISKTYKLISSKVLLKTVDGRIIYELPERSKLSLISELKD